MAGRGVAGDRPRSAPKRPSDSVLQALWSAARKPDSSFVLKPDSSICCQQVDADSPHPALHLRAFHHAAGPHRKHMGRLLQSRQRCVMVMVLCLMPAAH